MPHERRNSACRAKLNRLGFRTHSYGSRAHADRMDTNSAVDDQLRLHHLQVPGSHAGVPEGTSSAQWSSQSRADFDRIGNRWADSRMYSAPELAEAVALLNFSGSSVVAGDDGSGRSIAAGDRKSTRLNSSHLGISYA